MKNLTNKTRAPIKVPLPRGKSLRLGPSRSGQIRDEAADHPALKKLIEAGEIEIADADAGGAGGIDSSLGRSSAGGGHRKGLRRSRSGDR